MQTSRLRGKAFITNYVLHNCIVVMDKTTIIFTFSDQKKEEEKHKLMINKKKKSFRDYRPTPEEGLSDKVNEREREKNFKRKRDFWPHRAPH